MIANQREQQPDAWNREILDIMLTMFPADRRPVLLSPYTDPQFNGHNLLCDRIIVHFFVQFDVDICTYLGTDWKWFVHRNCSDC